MKSKSIILFLSLVFIQLSVFAHPPKKVELKYDKNTNSLLVTVTHGVADVKTHYINIIEVSVDNVSVKKSEPTEQTSTATEITTIVLPELKSGSVITVKATCNKFGSKSTTLKVE